MIDQVFSTRDRVVVERIEDNEIKERNGMIVGRSHPINGGFRYDVKIEGGTILQNLTSADLKLAQQPVIKHIWPQVAAK